MSQFTEWFRKNRVSKDHDAQLMRTLDEAKEEAEELGETIHALEGRQKAALDPKVMQEMRAYAVANRWTNRKQGAEATAWDLRYTFGDAYAREATAVASEVSKSAQFTKEDRDRLEKPAKFDRCVEHVKANNPGADAYAVCNAVLTDKSFAEMDDVKLHSVISKAVDTMSKAKDAADQWGWAASAAKEGKNREWIRYKLMEMGYSAETATSTAQRAVSEFGKAVERMGDKSYGPEKPWDKCERCGRPAIKMDGYPALCAVCLTSMGGRKKSEGSVEKAASNEQVMDDMRAWWKKNYLNLRDAKGNARNANWTRQEVEGALNREWGGFALEQARIVAQEFGKAVERIGKAGGLKVGERVGTPKGKIGRVVALSSNENVEVQLEDGVDIFHASELVRKSSEGSVYNLISRISANQRTATTKASTFSEAWNRVKPR
jgi:preprotein translocase subunit YajC